MAYTETQIIARISTVLNDPSTAIWGTAVISAQLAQTLREISRYSADYGKATVTFASTAPDLSISSLTDLVDVDMVEFGIDQDPKRYRNFQVRGSSVIVDLSFSPTAGATAYIWYNKIHALSGTTSNTMNYEEERLLIELAASQLAANISIDKINTLNLGGPGVWSDFVSWAERKMALAYQGLQRLQKPKQRIEWPKVD